MSEQTDSTLKRAKELCDKFNKFVEVDWMKARYATFEDVSVEINFQLFPHIKGTVVSQLELRGLVSGWFTREEVIAYLVLEAFRDWNEG